MDTTYTCECTDGRTITGKAEWTPNDLKSMSALQLAQALSEARDFAQYYSSHFFHPLQMIEAEKVNLQHRYTITKKTSLVFGIIAAIFTFLWSILAIIPALRFSGTTLSMAVLTFLSLLLLIPILWQMLSAQQDYAKRFPRLCSKQEKLIQQQEKAIYGTYSDLLISNFLLSPEYGLFEEGLELMIQALNTRKASNLQEAALLCRKSYPHSPVPRLITSIRSLSPAGKPEVQTVSDAPIQTTTTAENTVPDLQAVLQMSEHLNAAIKRYASMQKNAAPADASAGALNYEEETMILEFRTLTPDERRRISRIVHSFYSKQY